MTGALGGSGSIFFLRFAVGFDGEVRALALALALAMM
jgi:hypothetical protein